MASPSSSPRHGPSKPNAVDAAPHKTKKMHKSATQQWTSEADDSAGQKIKRMHKSATQQLTSENDDTAGQKTKKMHKSVTQQWTSESDDSAHQKARKVNKSVTQQMISEIDDSVVPSKSDLQSRRRSLLFECRKEDVAFAKRASLEAKRDSTLNVNAVDSKALGDEEWEALLKSVNASLDEDAFKEEMNGVFEAPPNEDSDTEETILRSWVRLEQESPCDPYGALRANEDATVADIKLLLDKRLKQLGGTSAGVVAILEARLRRAHDLLADDGRRRQYDSGLRRRRQEGKWARIDYENGYYEGDIDWRGADTPNDGERVPIRHGRGVTISDDHVEKYEGPYSEDRREGKGLQLWASGDVYLGDWWEDDMHGTGVYFYSNGCTYCGSFNRGQRHGRGRVKYPNGSTYKGQFSDNEFHGNGILTRCAVDKEQWQQRYVGEWRMGVREGEGLFMTSNGVRYKGQFVAGQYHGEASIVYENGDGYEGQFRNGRLHGEGVYFWAESCETYTGHFKDGFFHGEGRNEYTTLSLPNARPPDEDEDGWRVSYVGQWKDGQPDGEGRLLGAIEYEGGWRRGLRSGVGISRWSTGTTIESHWERDVRHGEAKIKWADGSSWEGALHKGLRHGAAKYVEVDNSQQEAEAKKGRKKPKESKQVVEQLGPIVREHKEQWHYGTIIKRDNILVQPRDLQVDDQELMKHHWDSAETSFDASVDRCVCGNIALPDAAHCGKCAAESPKVLRQDSSASSFGLRSAGESDSSSPRSKRLQRSRSSQKAGDKKRSFAPK